MPCKYVRSSAVYSDAVESNDVSCSYIQHEINVIKALSQGYTEDIFIYYLVLSSQPCWYAQGKKS